MTEHKINGSDGFCSFTTTLVEMRDGSGDALVPLDDEVLEAMGLADGDAVELAVEDGAIVIRRSDG